MREFKGKENPALRADAKTRARATDLRNESTPPEQVLWSRIRRKQLGGYRFRRQHPLGPYPADFYCHESALIVELDSSYHDQLHDLKRDHWLAGHGIETLRPTAGEIASDIDAACLTILRVLLERAEDPLPDPPPHAGEGALPSSPACGGGVAEGDGGGVPDPTDPQP